MFKQHKVHGYKLSKVVGVVKKKKKKNRMGEYRKSGFWVSSSLDNPTARLEHSFLILNCFLSSRWPTFF